MNRNRYITVLRSLLHALDEEIAMEAGGNNFDLERAITHAKHYGKRHKVTEDEVRMCLNSTPYSQLNI